MIGEIQIGNAQVEWIHGQYGPYMKMSKGDRWMNLSKITLARLIDAKVNIIHHIINSFCNDYICLFLTF